MQANWFSKKTTESVHWLKNWMLVVLVGKIHTLSLRSSFLLLIELHQFSSSALSSLVLLRACIKEVSTIMFSLELILPSSFNNASNQFLKFLIKTLQRFPAASRTSPQLFLMQYAQLKHPSLCKCVEQTSWMLMANCQKCSGRALSSAIKARAC